MIYHNQPADMYPQQTCWNSFHRDAVIPKKDLWFIFTVIDNKNVTQIDVNSVWSQNAWFLLWKNITTMLVKVLFMSFYVIIVSEKRRNRLHKSENHKELFLQNFKVDRKSICFHATFFWNEKILKES